MIDNLRASVIKADWYDPKLNPKLHLFAEHYGTVILPTKQYIRHKKGPLAGKKLLWPQLVSMR